MRSTGREPHLVSRLQGFGTTVFSEMTALAVAHEAVNLGQGFPDEDPPSELVAAAHEALDAGHHQYAPGPGVWSLRTAIAAHQRRFYDLDYDPGTEVTVTFGATEAVAAALLALCETGDEVVVLEPCYDAYTALIAMAGAVQTGVPLTPPPPGDPARGWALDLDRLVAAITPRTRILLLNSPHNPTGLVLDPQQLDTIAEVCRERDLVVVSDEVYEHLVYEGAHVPIATRPGMRERTVTISSAAKSFSCTGWKVGWACAPPPLAAAVRTSKQFLSFSGATPLQHAVAQGLGLPGASFERIAARHRRRRDLLTDGLRDLGIPATRPRGAYFLTADLAPLGHPDGEEFCRWAPAAVGVAAVPVSAFVRDPAPFRSQVRFAFCKRDSVIAEGIERLRRLVPGDAEERR